MTPILVAIAKLVRDLMTYDEQLIRIGRQNFAREDFSRPYVVIDALGAQQLLATNEMFDGTAESLSLGSLWTGPVTLDFYGTGAYTRVAEFCARLRTQTACDLQRTLGIVCYLPRNVIDVRALTGQQYGERIQVELTVSAPTNLTIDTLRTDIAQIEMREDDTGIFFTGETN